MPLFHTTLFANDPPGNAFVSRGAAWSFEKDSGVYRGPTKKMHEHAEKLRQQRGHAPTGNYTQGEMPVFFDMEIMIRAPGLPQAQQALNLLVSSIAVLEGSITFCPALAGSQVAINLKPHPLGSVRSIQWALS